MTNKTKVELGQGLDDTSNLPAKSVKQNLPATLQNDALLQNLKEAENLPDTDFLEVQSGEFLKMEAGEVLTLGFAGIEAVADYKDRTKEVDAAVFYNGEGKKLLATQTMLVSLCKKIMIPEGISAIVVRVSYEGKIKGQTNTYDCFKVAQL